ncbi:meiosis protein MEI2 [Penicillium odoratum]|uniref:meiosis protein MEI2 n=1 Tax=Penicillium odoratum TaxID=1167516 RepID=UPI002548A2B5|nr:meiosis protein MEI2 [Penicillium odoratum]KAJ5752341.1 meiosis protein MEI2 [Penicillium odoratum]
MSVNPCDSLGGSSSPIRSDNLKSPGTQLATFTSRFPDSDIVDLPTLPQSNRFEAKSPGVYLGSPYPGNGFNQVSFPRKQLKQEDFDMLRDLPIGAKYGSQPFGPNPSPDLNVPRSLNPLHRREPASYPTEIPHSLSIPRKQSDYGIYPNHHPPSMGASQNRNDLRNFFMANPSSGLRNLTQSRDAISPVRWPMRPVQSIQNVQPMQSGPSMQPVQPMQASFCGNRSIYPGPTSQVATMTVMTTTKDLRPYDRRFLVKNVDTNISGVYILDYCHSQDFRTGFGPTTHEVREKGQFWIGFSDMRQSQRAVEHFARDHPTWIVEPVGETTFKQGSRINSTACTFEDQVLAIVYRGPGRTIPPVNLVPAVRSLLETVGTVAEMRQVALEAPSQSPRFTMEGFVVRYYDGLHAVNATRSLNTISTPHFIMEVLPYHYDLENQKIRHWNGQPQGRDGRPGEYFDPEDNRARARTPQTPGRVEYDEQIIYPQNILQGQDRRCTVMLKNIPNSQTWDQLKMHLDVTSAGTYDFIYLRMDFEQRLNVGYAFINFENPMKILPFFTARHGTVWPGFTTGRPKVAEVSYATTQTYELLVEKFRNSPVMLDFPDNRPKLFYIKGPHAGEEAPFPTVNNFWTLAKGVERSKDSGLYRGGSRTDSHNPRRHAHTDLQYEAINTPVRGSRRRRERNKWGNSDVPKYRQN